MTTMELGTDEAKATKRKIYDWIVASVRQGFGRPIERDIKNRFGVSHGTASRVLAQYKKDQANGS